MIFAWRSPVGPKKRWPRPTDLIPAAEASDNPYVLSFALWVYGYAFRAADPVGALDALRRGMVIAQETDNRANETYLAGNLPLLEAGYGDPLAAFDFSTLVIRNFHDAGNTIMIHTSLAVLAALFDHSGATNPPPPSPGSPSAR